MNNNVPTQSPGQAIDIMTDGRDDPNRGPLDRSANAVFGETGGVNAQTSSNDDYTRTQNGGVVSAVFDSDDEARDAVAELRSAGVEDASLSLITQKRGTTTTSDADGEIVDEEHTNILRGILGGGALGAGLGVAALAIPGVGPLVAAGAIAATALPGAIAIGAGVGAAVGTMNEALKDHGVGDDDVSYYGDHMKNGGVLVTVNPQGADASRVRDILYACGGHNAGRARQA